MNKAHSLNSPQTSSRTTGGSMAASTHKAGWGWQIPTGGLALLLLGGVALYWTMNRSVTTNYVTQAVTRGAVLRSVTASGTVNPVITIQVGTYVSGVIQARYCDYNTEVKKGQPRKLIPAPIRSPSTRITRTSRSPRRSSKRTKPIVPMRRSFLSVSVV
jgi:HlyD family secretion protein